MNKNTRQIIINLTIVATFLILASLSAQAQTQIAPPSGPYHGVLYANSYQIGSLLVSSGTIREFGRFDIDMDVEAGASYRHRTIILDCDAVTGAACYGDVSLTYNLGKGLANSDYRRVEGATGSGPSIARKTAVRGDPAQWANWAHQINLGPGAKAALWISGDNPELSQHDADHVPNVIVINSNLNVDNAVIQYNAHTTSTGAFLRVFKGGKMIFEVTKDGIVRAKAFQTIP